MNKIKLTGKDEGKDDGNGTVEILGVACRESDGPHVSILGWHVERRRDEIRRVLGRSVERRHGDCGLAGRRCDYQGSSHELCAAVDLE